MKTKIINIAAKEIGTHENPIGSSNIKYNTWYYGRSVSGSKYPWCAVFVSWCANQAGIPTSIIPKTASVSSLKKFFVSKGLYHPNTKNYMPSVGDIMIQDSDAVVKGLSHTGIVVEVSGVSFYTIEGNTSNSVKKCFYVFNSPRISGFCSPQYISDTWQDTPTRQKINPKNQNQNQTNQQNEKIKQKSYQITSTIIRSITGGNNTKRQYININNQKPDIIELYIRNHENKTFVPILKDKIKWTTPRKNEPAQLYFTVIKDNIVSFNEGSTVIFKYNNNNIFYGYIFKKSRDKNHFIDVVAYDQLRYLKNKYTYVIKNKSLADIINMISADFGLITGDIEQSKYKIPYRIEDNKTLIDIIQTAISDTLLNTGVLYNFFDDFGKLALKDIKKMLIKDLLINGLSTQNFDYATSIDNQTYNKILLYADDKETGQRNFFISQDNFNLQRFGVLQLEQQLKSNENPINKGEILLKLYNKINRNLILRGVIGDYRVRGGCSVYCQFDLGDIIVNKIMLVEKAVHTFENNKHFMDLTLIGFDE